MIIIINGAATSGKDEVVKIAARLLQSTEIFNLSTIDNVKEACNRYFGFNYDIKDEKSRKFLSDIKDAWTEFNNGPFIDILVEIKYIKLHFNNYIIFVHCREPSEIQKFKDYYKDKCVTLLITRPDITIPHNHADQNVNMYKYDYYIKNDGSINDLQEKVKEFINTIL